MRQSHSATFILVFVIVLGLFVHSLYTLLIRSVDGQNYGCIGVEGPLRETLSHNQQLSFQQTSSRQPGIPKILHQIFLEGEATYWRNATKGDDFVPNYYARKKEQGENKVAFKEEWRLSCQRFHPEWRYIFWDMEGALAFIKQKFPWFLPTFEGYSDVVAKGDALRPLILQAMGGVYLDLDVECFRPADPFLEGHDLVLQAERDDESAVINAVMASVPQHPLWEMVIKVMMERAHGLDGINSVFYVTGPALLSEAFANYSAAHQSIIKEMTALGSQNVLSNQGAANGYRRMKLRHQQYSPGLTPKVYKLKQFFVPCNWLTQDECTAIDKALEKPPQLAGFHHWAGSWKVQ